MGKVTSKELLTAASNLVEVYNKDDLETCLGNDIVQFAHYVDAFKNEQAQDVSRGHLTYQLIIRKQVQGSFPNMKIVLRMYLVLMVSNCRLQRRSFIFQNEEQTLNMHEQ